MLLTFLRRVSEGKLPPNVVSALQSWDKRRARVRLRRALLLQVESESVMEELSASPQIREYLREMISPKTAIVAQEDWPALLDELRKLGYSPQVEREP